MLGGVSEWFKEAVLKTVVLKGTGGSNPSSSASKINLLKVSTNGEVPKPVEGDGLLNH
jgi:hypothetical protein